MSSSCGVARGVSVLCVDFFLVFVFLDVLCLMCRLSFPRCVQPPISDRFYVCFVLSVCLSELGEHLRACRVGEKNSS